MTSRRVSRRLRMAGLVSSVPSSKCLTKTVPEGNFHSPVGAKATVSEAPYGAPLFGSAIQRVLSAPSDQSGQLTLYGTRLLLTVSAAVLLNTPVALNRLGIVPALVVGMFK